MTPTLVAPRISRSVNIEPETSFQSRIFKYSGDSPAMVVDQLRPLAMACAEVVSSGLTATTSGTSRPMASASVSVRTLALPRPEFTPPARRLPAKMVSKFWPREEIWDWMRACAPLPRATIATTEATPMMMPSAVRVERILLRRNARNAIIAVNKDWRINVRR